MEQAQVNTLLRYGIVFSLVWLAGFGSAFALFAGYKARKEIKKSNRQLSGLGRAWWCLVVGGLGVLVWAPILIAGTFA